MKDDRVYLRHILRRVARIEECTTGGRERFFASHLIQDSGPRNLQTLASADSPLLRPGLVPTETNGLSCRVMMYKIGFLALLSRTFMGY